MISKWKQRRVFIFELVAHDTDFITEKPRSVTGIELATLGVQTKRLKVKLHYAYKVRNIGRFRPRLRT